VAITALDNRATALIRYAIGDMAVAPSGAVCPCGRPGPLLPRVLGRQVPMLSIAGRTVSPWGVVARMHELAFLRQFQLAQPAPDELIVRIRVRDGQALDRPAVQRLVVEELGPIVRTEVEEVEAMPRLPSGKAAPVVVATDALDAPVPGA
jgi:phenylacetate-coenzyme A ligase PaaK-like adenylate-forming protein